MSAAALPAGAPARWLPALEAGLLALGFFLPFSTAGTSISLLVLLGLVVLNGQQVIASRFWREPVIALGLALLAWITLRTLAGEGLHGKSVGWANQYHELLMIPLLWVLFRLASRPQLFLAGLAAGATLLASVQWLDLVLPLFDAWLHPRRIAAGFSMALVAFVLFEQGRLARWPRPVAFGLSAFLAATVLFANDGRTGHLVLLLLVACAAWRGAQGRWRWLAVIGIVLGALLVASLSANVRLRVAETMGSTEGARKTEEGLTSTQVRLALLRNAWEVAEGNLATGTGWGRYAQAYEEAARLHPAAAGAPGKRIDNPHNEYLLQLGAGGLPAFVLFVGWLAATVLRGARRSPNSDDAAGTLACVALAFALGSLFNSMLLDFLEGHLYGALLAWLLAQQDRT